MTFKGVSHVARYPGEKKIVLVTGDRWWNDREAILRVLKALPKNTVLIHGGASGADSLADLCALELGMPRANVPYFGTFHRAGGPIRNTFILHILCGLQLQGWSVTVLAFHDNLKKSRGTKDMLKKAADANLNIRFFKHKEVRVGSQGQQGSDHSESQDSGEAGESSE